MQKKPLFSNRIRHSFFTLIAVIVMVSVCAAADFRSIAQEQILYENNPGAVQFSASIETRTHLVTVPAVLTLDVVPEGGSGLYNYSWSYQYTDGSEEVDLSEEAGVYNYHKEISIVRTGELVVSVRVTDRHTGAQVLAQTEKIRAVDRNEWSWDSAAEQEQIDDYYKKLLGNLQNREDPLEDEVLTDSMKQRFKEQNFTDSQITVIFNVLKNADPLYRDLYLLSFYHYTMFGMQGTGSCYSNPPNAAFVSATSSARSFSGTYFHEAGHGIHMSLWDLENHPLEALILTEGFRTAALKAGNSDLEEKIMQALEQDVRERILMTLEDLANGELTPVQMDKIADALINGDAEITETIWWWTETIHPDIRDDSTLRSYYIKVRDTLSQELSEIPYSNSNMIGDIYGGMTNNKLNLPYGHPGNYWYTSDGEPNGMQLCEAWAEFFSAQIRKDSYYTKKNAQYLPASVTELENLAYRLKDYYQEYYLSIYS